MRRSEDGSVLVEALVSTAIVAMMLISAYRIVGDSAARHEKVQARRYALMTARSQLASVGSVVPLASGATEGQDGDSIWRIEMEPCPSRKSTAGILYCVAVSVRAATGGPPLVTLSTRRLAPLV